MYLLELQCRLTRSPMFMYVVHTYTRIQRPTFVPVGQTADRGEWTHYYVFDCIMHTVSLCTVCPCVPHSYTCTYACACTCACIYVYFGISFSLSLSLSLSLSPSQGNLVDLHGKHIRSVDYDPDQQDPVYTGPLQVLGPGFAPFKPYVRPSYFYTRVSHFCASNY